MKYSILVLFILISVNIAAQIQPGSYLIGASQPKPYNTITNAINYLNEVGVGGSWERTYFLLTDSLYEESGIWVKEYNGGEFCLVTLKPAPGVNTTIRGTNTKKGNYNFFLRVTAEHFVINGSNNGTNSQNLIIESNLEETEKDKWSNQFMEKWKDFITGSELRTLVNENGELIIGNSIYKVAEDWVVYEVVDGNFNTLNELDNIIKSKKRASFPENVIVHNDNKQDKRSWRDCRVNTHRTNYYNPENDVQVKIRVTITNSPFGHYAKAETTSYKRKRRRWEKRKADVKARVYGTIRDGNCSESTYFDSGLESKYTREVKAKISFANTASCKSGDIYSWHQIGSWKSYFELKW